ncbi:MAG: RNA polymerase-binding protein DksA, partial [Alteriqipengyuania sp.]
MAATALSDSEILARANRALPVDYTPQEDEEYMNERQQEFFRKLLIEWKRSLRTEAGGTLQNLQETPLREPDLTDRASSETDWGIELRTRDR